MTGLDGTVTVQVAGPVHAAWSDASAGDLRPVGRGPDDGAALADFAAAVAAPTGASFDEVAWVTQVHGTRVVTEDTRAWRGPAASPSAAVGRRSPSADPVQAARIWPATGRDGTGVTRSVG